MTILGKKLDDETKKIRDEENVTIRTLRVALDPRQYQLDTEKFQADRTVDPYEAINVIVRRGSRENNFRFLLDSLQAIMHDEVNGDMDGVMPDWFYSIFLGIPLLLTG